MFKSYKFFILSILSASSLLFSTVLTAAAVPAAYFVHFKVGSENVELATGKKVGALLQSGEERHTLTRENLLATCPAGAATGSHPTIENIRLNNGTMVDDGSLGLTIGSAQQRADIANGKATFGLDCVKLKDLRATDIIWIEYFPRTGIRE